MTAEQDFLDAAIAAQTASSEPAKPTRLSRARESADAIKQISIQAALQFVGQTNAGFEMLWNNPYGLSPQEVATALGPMRRPFF